MEAIEAAWHYLRDTRPRIVADLREFLAIPSISALTAHRDDVRAAARWLRDFLERIGLDGARVEDTEGHPVVRAAWGHDPNRPTVLLYGHFDVQPVDPIAAWTHPPFEPYVENDILYGRGASDDKGQVLMALWAVEAWLQTARDLPVNLNVLIEGEEEIGSPHLPGYIASHREDLAADWAIISDTPMYADGIPAICYGLRGLAELEVTIRGPHSDLHSGVYGGMVANPAHVLAALLASLHDEAGRVAVPGFYDGMIAPDPAERNRFARLPFDPEAEAADIGVPELVGEPGYSPLERTWIRPTLEVNGMWSGFIGEGRKTIIPAEAHAKITCRLVPGQDPARIQESVRRHLLARAPRGVRVDVRTGEGSPAALTPVGHPAMAAAEEAIATVFGHPPALIRMGGSIPVVVTFQEMLHAPTLLLGFALPNEHFHAPNEHFHLHNLERGARVLARLWATAGGTSHGR